jgi:chemotaxis methyl-accepting protein methylase
VQDLPKTISEAPSKIPQEYHDRIQFQAHDFYTEQPVKDADVFFFRWVCHNQSDKYGVKMLQQLIPALKPGAKIVIHDNCLPAPNTADIWDEKITRYSSAPSVHSILPTARDADVIISGRWI